MKTLNLQLTTVLIALFAIIGSGELLAERGMRNGNGQAGNRGGGQGYFCENLPGITDTQKQKIADLRTANMKEMTAFRNQMQEKRSRLQTLQTADKANMTEINKLIDEMGKIRTERMKKTAAHKQAIRNVLTAEQKVYFDAQRGNKGNCMGKGRRGGRGQGNGNGRGNCGRF